MGDALELSNRSTGLAPLTAAVGVGIDEDEAPVGGDGPRRCKRKMALVVGYVGHKYRGLQINYEVEEKSEKKSVEEVLRKALVRAKCVTPLNSERLEYKIGWSRSSRTDAGVHAVRLVISCKLLVVEDELDIDGHCSALVAEVNQELPADIRCFSATKVANSFDAKKACSWREYEYLLPSDLALRQGEDSPGATELAKRLECIMRKFEGCHSFHNFTRLKAADLLWRDPEGKAGNGKEGRGKEAKGKGKGGKGKGKKRKADEAFDDPQDEDMEDGGPEGLSEDEPDIEPAAKPVTEVLADKDVAGAVAVELAPEFVTPRWVEVCAKDPESGTWRERSPQVMKHTRSTIFMCVVEPTREGALLRVRLRGKFFLYNQIRMLVGTAAAIASGNLPEEFLDLALKLQIEFHMPLAPPTGLLLRTAGFCEMDRRAGYMSMDDDQARCCMMPGGGLVLNDLEATRCIEAFVCKVEEEIEQAWQEGSDVPPLEASPQSDASSPVPLGPLAEWKAKLASMRVCCGEVLEELRQKAADIDLQEAEARSGKIAAHCRRREERLSDSTGSFVGLMPKSFASDLMVHFRLMPGWRVSHLQHALSERLRRWGRVADERPAGFSSPPETKELLDYIASVGVDNMAEEGARDR